MIDVDVVQADGLVADQRLARAGCRHVVGLVLQHLGAAVLMDEDPVRHASPPVGQLKPLGLASRRSRRAAGSVERRFAGAAEQT